jgi:hypothetical protein
MWPPHGTSVVGTEAQAKKIGMKCSAETDPDQDAPAEPGGETAREK